MLPIILIIYYHLMLCQGFNLNERIHALQQSGANCALKLAKQHFEQYSIITLVKTTGQYKTNLSLALSDEDLILEKLVEEERWTLVMKQTGEGGREKIDFGFEKIHNYVIVFQNLTHLDKTLTELSLANSWNPHANFLLHVIGFLSDWNSFLTQVVQLLWKFWVINVAIFFPAREINGYMVSYQIPKNS